MLGINGGGDVPRILRVFLDVDVRGRHKLDIETFFEYFNIEFTEYNRMAFRLIAFGGQVLSCTWELAQCTERYGVGIAFFPWTICGTIFLVMSYSAILIQVTHLILVRSSIYLLPGLKFERIFSPEY